MAGEYRKFEDGIFECRGKRGVTFKIQIRGQEFGRVKSLEMARKIRDDILAKGGFKRLRRPQGTGGIEVRPNGRCYITLDAKRVGTAASYGEAEAVLSRLLASEAVEIGTWRSGRNTTRTGRVIVKGLPANG